MTLPFASSAVATWFHKLKAAPKLDSFNKKENITAAVKFLLVYQVHLYSKILLLQIAIIYSLLRWKFLQSLLRSFDVALCSSHPYVGQTHSASSLHYLPFLLVRTKTGNTLNIVLNLWWWAKWSGLLDGQKRVRKTQILVKKYYFRWVLYSELEMHITNNIDSQLDATITVH